MKILVINCGSSTIKFQLINMEDESVIAKGRCDKIGYDSSNMIYKNIMLKKGLDAVSMKMPTHKEAMQALLDTLLDKDIGVITSLDEIYAVGHRVVHGGEIFKKAELVTKEVLKEVSDLSELAPLHNPGAVMGIEAIQNVASKLHNIVVFDTAFHQSMPDINYLYAIDLKYYHNNKIRKYGAHGTSYMYILDTLSKELNKKKEDINAIVCHIGGGASVCAIKNGKSYDTSMGFTPLEGLVMETRSGDIDPAAVLKIMRDEKLSIDEMDEILNKKSGRLGLAKIGDFRLLKEAAQAGNEIAKLTIKLQANRTKKYIGAYMAELNRVDAIVFTGGICENNADQIQKAIENMECLGVELDNEKNERKSDDLKLISKDTSKVKLYMIPTNEEVEIARQTLEVLERC